MLFQADSSMNVNRHASLSALVLGFALTWPQLVGAFNFVPTEAEFLAWPNYCQVVYTRTTIGKGTAFRNRITRDDEIAAEAILGSDTFGSVGVHHYCAGLAWLVRARIETDPQQKRFALGRAVEETEYTLERAAPPDQMFVPAATQMATVLYEQGRSSEALRLLDQTLSQDPSSPLLYTTMATIYYRQGNYEQARDVLLQGDESVGGLSADIQYSLGLVLVKLGNFELAADYAAKAYDKGYPLAGLRTQLERQGYWPLTE